MRDEFERRKKVRVANMSVLGPIVLLVSSGRYSQAFSSLALAPVFLLSSVVRRG